MRLTELGSDPDAPFPPLEQALREPDGLLAWGGDLHPARLLKAYRHGCFPWYEQGQPILWWSPDPRLVLPTDRFHVSRRFARDLRTSDWLVSADTRFEAVIRACARIARTGQHGTWIVPAMIEAYSTLHAQGHAHSVEVSDAGGSLIGGIYGIAIGRMFFGESMFSAVTNASKVALLALCRFLERHACPWIDCQVETDHLRSLGAVIMPRASFAGTSRRLCDQPGPTGSWCTTFGRVATSELVPGAP